MFSIINSVTIRYTVEHLPLNKRNSSIGSCNAGHVLYRVRE